MVFSSILPMSKVSFFSMVVWLARPILSRSLSGSKSASPVCAQCHMLEGEMSA